MYRCSYSSPCLIIISIPTIKGSLSKLKSLKEHEQEPTVFLQCFSTLWGLFSHVLWQGERQIKTLQGHATYFCECFHAVRCMDLPLSGFLFSLLLAFLLMYPQTLDLSLSLITSTKKNSVALMTTCIFGRSQQSCIANLHAESLAPWRGSTIWKPVMMPLYVTSPLQNVFRTITWPQYLCR